MSRNIHEQGLSNVGTNLPVSQQIGEVSKPSEIDAEIDSIIADLQLVQLVTERTKHFSAVYELNGSGIAADDLITPQQSLSDYFEANTRRFPGGFPRKAKLLERLIQPRDRALFQMPAGSIHQAMEDRNNALADTGDERKGSDAFISYAYFVPGETFNMKLQTTLDGVTYNLKITPQGQESRFSHTANIAEYLEIRTSTQTVFRRLFNALTQ